MGRRHLAQKLYYQLLLDKLVPHDHLLRRIAEAVDFSFIRSLCRPLLQHHARPLPAAVAATPVLAGGRNG